MKNTIYRRRSCRSYAAEPVSQAQRLEIETFCQNLRPLDPDIRVCWQILSADQVRFYMPWKSPHLIAVFSENKPGFLENAGFMFQQVDLFLQSKGLGVCWMGLGKPRSQIEAPAGMEFVILLPFGTPKEPLSREARKFPRKSMADISDQDDPRLECARVAPSSTNSQPWYFTHEGDTIHAFRSNAGILRHAMLGTMNRIDLGIALAHLYVENTDTFRYFHTEPQHTPDGYSYTGSITL